MKPTFSIRLVDDPKKPSIEIEGFLKHGLACGVLRELLRNVDFLRVISWETVRLFSAPVRRVYLALCGQAGIELADDVIKDILLNQCASVQEMLLGNAIGLAQAKRAFAGYDSEEMLRLWRNNTTYEARKLLAEAMSLTVIPVILPTCRGDEMSREVLEARLSKS